MAQTLNTSPGSNKVARFKPWDKIIMSKALRVRGPMLSFSHCWSVLWSYSDKIINMLTWLRRYIPHESIKKKQASGIEEKKN